MAVHELETKPSLDTNYGLILKSQHVSKKKLQPKLLKILVYVTFKLVMNVKYLVKFLVSRNKQFVMLSGQVQMS